MSGEREMGGRGRGGPIGRIGTETALVTVIRFSKGCGIQSRVLESVICAGCLRVMCMLLSPAKLRATHEAEMLARYVLDMYRQSLSSIVGLPPRLPPSPRHLLHFPWYTTTEFCFSPSARPSASRLSRLSLVATERPGPE